jgi:hypothetical protein
MIGFSYGQHFPNAYQAVEWVTSPDSGTFRELSKIEYIWNYYDFPAPLPDNHPYDRNSLISYANGSQYTTCRDANAHLLFDYNHDGELDSAFARKWNDIAGQNAACFAYMEHSGRGVNNEVKGNPFSNFWFDDNSLAKYMNEAFFFSSGNPCGLSEYDDFTRWRIVGGDNTNWTPYSSPSSYNDQLALNGFYYITKDDVSLAFSSWKQILHNSQALYDSSLQRYSYPGIHEAYHYGLWLILTSALRLHYPSNKDLLQQYVSIRSNILSFQAIDSGSASLVEGPFYGWTSDVSGGNSLMNTESVATNVLGLGANALFSYEIGRLPLKSDSASANFYMRSHNVLSAVEGISTSGYLAYGGPYVTLSKEGNYLLEIFIRSGALASSSSRLETVLLKSEIYDSAIYERLLAERDIFGKDFAVNNEWAVITMNFTVVSAPMNNSIEFRLSYLGFENIDVSLIRIKQYY